MCLCFHHKKKQEERLLRELLVNHCSDFSFCSPGAQSVYLARHLVNKKYQYRGRVYQISQLRRPTSVFIAHVFDIIYKIERKNIWIWFFFIILCYFLDIDTHVKNIWHLLSSIFCSDNVHLHLKTYLSPGQFRIKIWYDINLKPQVTMTISLIYFLGIFCM